MIDGAMSVGNNSEKRSDIPNVIKFEIGKNLKDLAEKLKDNNNIHSVFQLKKLLTLKPLFSLN